MKILMVNKFLYLRGGAETYVLRLGEYLESIGHEVEYFGMYDEKNIVGNSSALYTTNMDFHAKSLQRLSYPFKIIYSGENKKKFGKLLKSFKPDVIHLNNVNYQITPSILYEAKKQGIPMVITVHDYQMLCPNHMLYIPQQYKICELCVGGKYLHCLKNKCIHGSAAKSFLGMLESKLYHAKKTYGLQHKIICPSRFMEKKLQTLPELVGKTCTLHNFIDAQPTTSAKEDYVLYFGRFSQEKGIGTLVKVCRSLPNISFIFAGNGPLESSLEGIPNIRNVGFVKGEALTQLIAKARFSVYPSEWYENCPFSVLESQMFGTPVVGADIGGIPELIQPGKTGVLFKSGDELELRHKIEALWDNPKLLQQMSAQCTVSKFVTIEEYSHKLMDIYAEVIGARG